MSHIGHDIIDAADIAYWATYETKSVPHSYWSDGHIQTTDQIRVKDAEDEDAEWSEWISADQVRAAFRKYICEGREDWNVHPSNYEFSILSYRHESRNIEETDYDATTGDYLIQQLAFGEIVYG